MSHTVKLKSQVKCLESIQRACTRMQAKCLGETKTSFYSGKQQTGIGVQLPAWKYPIVIDLESGEIVYDNYGGSWGKLEVLDTFKQAYGVEKAKLEGEIRGYEVSETQLTTGEIKVTLQVGGGTGLEAADGDPMSGGYGIAESSE